MFYGKFNNSLVDKHQPTKYELENLPSLYDVNLFDINMINTKLDSDLSPFKHLLNNQIQSRYFSPYVLSYLPRRERPLLAGNEQS